MTIPCFLLHARSLPPVTCHSHNLPSTSKAVAFQCPTLAESPLLELYMLGFPRGVLGAHFPSRAPLCMMMSSTPVALLAVHSLRILGCASSALTESGTPNIGLYMQLPI